MTEVSPEFARGVMGAWRIPDACISFARAMQAVQGVDFDVFYYLDKPYKWADEFAAWISAGSPTSEADAGWDRFAVKALA